MKKRLFLSNILITYLVLLCFFVSSIYIAQLNNLSFAKDSVINYTEIYAGFYQDNIDPDDFTHLSDNLRDSLRVTVIASDGRVLKDSRPVDETTLENHLDREEVKAAMSGNPKISLRRSSTIGMDLIYYAVKVPVSNTDYVFIRVSTPVTSINEYLNQSLPLLILSMLAIGIIYFFFSRFLTDKLMQPLDFVRQNLRHLSTGWYKPVLAASGYDEINQITNEINEISIRLDNNIASLREEKNKLDYVLNNINDGLFAVDEKRLIVLVNASAMRIFKASGEICGKDLNYLTFDHTLSKNIDSCIKTGQGALFEFSHDTFIYLVTIKRLPQSELTTVILTDITQSRQNQSLREEFFANASHELKTPLTAIKGFNELVAINNRDESLNKFIDQIARETDRMLSLISDMLKLSELENSKELFPSPVSLEKTVEEVKDSLETVLKDKNISVIIEGSGTVIAEPEHIYELIKNLFENAVRYNNQNGSVNISIEQTASEVTLKVADTGIGISVADQARIFERFYRVEKSRSQKNGGTGLGLSIVKHICNLYDAKLTLHSRPGIGTKVTVIFKAES